jgi:hypothetical protein
VNVIAYSIGIYLTTDMVFLIVFLFGTSIP